MEKDTKIAVRYLMIEGVKGVKVTATPRSNSISGYGNKLPTRWMVHYLGRWRRVYAICWSNAASCYVRHGKENVYLGSFDPNYWEEECQKGGATDANEKENKQV